MESMQRDDQEGFGGASYFTHEIVDKAGHRRNGRKTQFAVYFECIPIGAREPSSCLRCSKLLRRAEQLYETSVLRYSWTIAMSVRKI
jgi:hypothetical protein